MSGERVAYGVSSIDSFCTKAEGESQEGLCDPDVIASSSALALSVNTS